MSMNDGRDPEQQPYSSILTRLFDTPEFQELSSPARLLLLVLRLNDDANWAVAYRLYEEPLRERTGLSKKHFRNAMEELVEEDWIRYKDRIVWVINGLKYEPRIDLGNDDHKDLVRVQLSSLPRSSIVLQICDYYDIPTPEGYPELERWRENPGVFQDENGSDESMKSVRKSEEEKRVIEKLSALSGIGSTTAEQLYGAGYREPDELKQSTVGELEAIDGIGEKKAQSIIEAAGGEVQQEPDTIARRLFEHYADLDSGMNHYELSTKRKTAINNTVEWVAKQKYGQTDDETLLEAEQDIKEAMNNYDYVCQSEKCWWTHDGFAVEEFLTRRDRSWLVRFMKDDLSYFEDTDRKEGASGGHYEEREGDLTDDDIEEVFG